MTAKTANNYMVDQLKAQVKTALEDVKDPEIRALSVVELGIIVDIQADEEGHVKVVMTPTFSGCPALNIMQEQVKTRAGKVPGVTQADVEVNYDVQWNTNMISDKGRQKMQEFGITPPACYSDDLDVSMVEDAECPHCGSSNTTMQSPFGPTLCRSIHYCRDCQETFEQFKPVG
jgi:ring-1,2-phenylacetyl-CoA epoxidase subunit PaaD